MPGSNSRVRRPAFAVALLSATAMSSVGIWQAAPAFAQATVEHTVPIDVGRPAVQALPGFPDLVQKVNPAMATISSTMREQSADEGGSPFQPGSPQAHQFQQFSVRMQARTQAVDALGPGFIIDAQGHIVTNNHVVKDASNMQVTLTDGCKLPVKVIGVDPKTDLAVLQVKSNTPLLHLASGDSSAARVGDWVVAVGNQFGLGGTVTADIPTGTVENMTLRRDGQRDGRSFDHWTLEAIRMMAVERILDGEPASSVRASFGFSRTTIYKWIKAASTPGVGLEALRSTPRQEQQVVRWINGCDPRQYGLDFGFGRALSSPL